jgi:hypothetical protein
LRTVAATPDLIPFLLAGMTAERRAKFDADGIAQDIAASDITYCGLGDEGVVTMGGVMPTHMPGVGYTWQIITDVRRHKRAYLLQGREVLARFHALYPVLVVCIGPDEIAARRHAKRFGWHDMGEMDHFGTVARVYRRTAP